MLISENSYSNYPEIFIQKKTIFALFLKNEMNIDGVQC